MRASFGLNHLDPVRRVGTLHSGIRRAFGLIAFAITFALAAAMPSLAAQEKAAEQQCSGNDMLAELAATDPETHGAVVAESEKLANAKSLLWKIERDDTPVSYLFGTMHLSDRRVTTLPPMAAEALSKSDTVILEVADLSPQALAAAVTRMGALIFYGDGGNLAAQLTHGEFRKVQSIVSEAGMPEDMASVMRPWLVSTLLSTSPCARRMIAAGVPVLDVSIAEEARSRGIPVVGLETVGEQLKALSGIPDDQQIQMLKAGLNYVDRQDDLLETMVQMYLQRKMGAAIPFQIALAKRVGVPQSAFEGFKRILLEERNVRMRDGALSALKVGGVFMAVGALHLPGDRGLVALLRQAGYTVTAAE